MGDDCTVIISRGQGDALSGLRVECVFFGGVITVSQSRPLSTSVPHLCDNKPATGTSSGTARVASAWSLMGERSALAGTVVTACTIRVMPDAYDFQDINI